MPGCTSMDVGLCQNRSSITQTWCCVNSPLKEKLFYIILKNSVRTAKKATHFTITKINWLALFKEIIAVYSENYKKHTNTTAAVRLDGGLL
jgi:hypothetical protein